MRQISSPSLEGVRVELDRRVGLVGRDRFAVRLDLALDQPSFPVADGPGPAMTPNPMLVTLLPIVTLDRLLQPENAPSPMLVTLSGIATLDSPVQLRNALLPILVTLLGMVTLVRPLQP
jgi:hypothetical protein